jgi:GT2 family glycosyltransferase
MTPSQTGVPPKVVIVILNWNGLPDTLECLDSIGRLTYPNFEVIVVDNGSRLDDASRIGECTIVGRVLKSPVNLGYAGGSNLGIRSALDMRADYVWLLNNDVVVEPDSLMKLVSAGETHARIGLLSPVIYHYENRAMVLLTGTFVDLELEVYRVLRSLDETEIGQRGQDFALGGTALLLKRSVVDRIGGFDERFFAYVEDTDFSVSAMTAGFGTALVRGARVYHKYGRSLGGRDSPVREYLLTRNMFLFWTKHLDGRWRRLSYPARYLAWVIERAVDERSQGHEANSSLILAGAWDALRGRWGSWESRGSLPPWLEKSLTRWVLDWHPFFWSALLRGDLRHILREMVTRLPGRRQRDNAD